jgi:hypothetical protein
MFSVSRTGTDFTVQHYAGEVRYTSAEFLSKNRDRNPEAVMELLRHAKNGFLAGLFADGGDEASPSPLARAGAAAAAEGVRVEGGKAHQAFDRQRQSTKASVSRAASRANAVASTSGQNQLGVPEQTEAVLDRQPSWVSKLRCVKRVCTLPTRTERMAIELFLVNTYPLSTTPLPFNGKRATHNRDLF